MSAAQIPVTFWIASMGTRHFDFDAFGATEQEARNALKAGLAEHEKRCGGLEDDWFTEDDFNVRSVTLGTAYIDGPRVVS